MKTLDNCPEIHDLGAKIGAIPPDQLQGIVDWCLERVAGWAHEAGGVQCSGQLEALICQKLATSVEEIHSEADFACLEPKFSSLGRVLVFAWLRGILKPNANGVKIWRSNGLRNWRSRLVCKLPLYLNFKDFQELKSC